MRKVINEEMSCKHLLVSLGKLQQLGQTGLCPRCGYRPMNPNLTLNALSRQVDVYICPSCGIEEAMMAAAQEAPLPLQKWALFQPKEEEDATLARYTFMSAVPEIRDALRTKELYALGLALEQDCPDNDCRIYKNTFNMARELDGAIEVVDGYPATVLRYRLHERIRELGEMWRENPAILAYRAQYKGPKH